MQLKVQPSDINDHLFHFIPKDAISIIFLLAAKSIGAIVLVSKQWNHHAIELFTPHISSKLYLSIVHIQQCVPYPALLTAEFKIPPPKGLTELRSAITAIMETQAERMKTVPVDDMPSLLDRVVKGDPGFALEMVAAAHVLQRITGYEDQLLLRSLPPNFLAEKLASDPTRFPIVRIGITIIIDYMEDLCSKGHYQRAFALIPSSYAKDNPETCKKIAWLAFEGGDVELAYTYYNYMNDAFPYVLFDQISYLAHNLQRFDILFSLFQNRYPEPQAEIKPGTARTMFPEEMAKAGVPHLAIAFVQKFFPPSRVAACMKAVARTAVDHNYCNELFQALLSMKPPEKPPENYYYDVYIPVARVFARQGKRDLAFELASKYVPQNTPGLCYVYSIIALNAVINKDLRLYELVIDFAPFVKNEVDSYKEYGIIPTWYS